MKFSNNSEDRCFFGAVSGWGQSDESESNHHGHPALPRVGEQNGEGYIVRLESALPYDRARNYQVGGLIGAISVKISMEESPLFARPPKE